MKKSTPEQKSGICSAVGEKLWLPPGYRPEYGCRFHKIITIKGLSYAMIFSITWAFGKASILVIEWVV